MILYNSAFDLYHTIFRLLHLINKLKDDKTIEVERLRIWDFYLLFPNEILEITPFRNEKDLKSMLKQFKINKNNPYQDISDERMILEKIKPYQLSALHCLASYQIISKDDLLADRINVISKEMLSRYINKIGVLSVREKNIITIVSSQFYDISLVGDRGLKKRSNLIETKYDAK